MHHRGGEDDEDGDNLCATCAAELPWAANYCHRCGAAEGCEAEVAEHKPMLQRKSTRDSIDVLEYRAAEEEEEDSDDECDELPESAVPSDRSQVAALSPKRSIRCSSISNIQFNEEVWMENQDLHDRIFELEKQLREVVAENEELEAFKTGMDARLGRRGSSSRIKPLNEVDFLGRGSLSDAETVDTIPLNRTRLRWQNAILAVRLNNLRMKNLTLQLKMRGAEWKFRAAFSSLCEVKKMLASERKASDDLRDHFELDRHSFTEAHEIEKRHLQREVEKLEDELAVVAPSATIDPQDQSNLAAQLSLNFCRSDSDEDTSQPASRDPDQRGGRRRENELRVIELESLVQDAEEAKQEALVERDLFAGEAERMRARVQELEQQLRDTKLDGEAAAEAEGEVQLLHQHCHKLEQIVQTMQQSESQWREMQSQPWWQLFGSNFCTTGRGDGARPEFGHDAPTPFVLRGLDPGDIAD